MEAVRTLVRRLEVAAFHTQLVEEVGIPAVVLRNHPLMGLMDRPVQDIRHHKASHSLHRQS